MWQRSIARDIEREACKAQMLAVPEAERLESGRQFMSAHNRRLLRERAAMSATDDQPGAFPADFVDDFVEPGPDDDVEFGIDHRACGFRKFAARHGDEQVLPHLRGPDFDAHAARGIRLQRSRTPAGGARHCDFRFSRWPPDPA